MKPHLPELEADTIQKAVANNPDVSSTPASVTAGAGGGSDQEMPMLLASLREVISAQAHEMEDLRKKIKELSNGKNDEVESPDSLIVISES